MSTTPRPWRLHIEAGCATIFDAKDNVVGPIGDLELGWSDSETGIYHDPEDDVPPLKLIVYAVNTLDEAKAALEAMQKACDEWAAEFTQKKRAMNWGIVNDAYIKCGRVLARMSESKEKP